MFGFEFSVGRIARALCAIALATLLSGCASFYVDNSLHDLSQGEKVQIANPQPVQMLFDFQTKGAHNGAATDLVKSKVVAAVQNSGLFSQVSPDPVPGGALLNVVINNVPLSDDAFVKGFATGFTFGLIGSTVGDGYICTVDYLPDVSAPKISKSMRDAIYTSMGATAEAPEHAQKVSNANEALEIMVRQIMANTLNELAKDSYFGKAARVASK